MANEPNEEKLVGVLRKQAQKFLNRTEVTSVGVGYRVKDGKPTDELCIQFTVDRKLAPEALEAAGMEPLPKEFVDEDGNAICVDVIERSYKASVTLMGEAEILSSKQMRRTRVNPLRPGVSVSTVKGTAGTIGGFVYDADNGQPYILSNWHVLHGPHADIGSDVIQPGSFDGGTAGDDRIGVLVRSHLGLAGDCAICSIEGRQMDPSILELNVTPRRIGKVNIGDKVVKSGRTTGVTYGVVKRVGVVVKLDYPGCAGQQIGGFEIGVNQEKAPPDGEISMGGDSGSFWMMDSGDGLADVVVGLHFAGETDPAPEAEHALACSIHSVLDKLHISLNPRKAGERGTSKLYRSMGFAGPTGPRAEAEQADPPPLNLDTLSRLEEMLETRPDELMAQLRKRFYPYIDEDLFRHHLSRARAALQRPGDFAPHLEAKATFESLTSGLPADFNFPGMDLSEIPIEPENHKFEEIGDLLGWIIFGAGPAIFPGSKAPFRDHESHGSRFEYRLPEPGDTSPLEIALFSDFGTGLYHSRYIAKQLRTRRYPCAIHLGDVYYAGRESEFTDNFITPLTPLMDSTQLFMLNSNHEMYSGGRWYFDFLDRKRQSHPHRQVQEGSYFSLSTDRFQIVGVDTAYHDHGRVAGAKLLEWVRARLSQGRAAGRINILLTADHPYKYGDDDISDLLTEDFRDSGNNRLIDLWFWGNTHYCGLFDRGNETPFIGSCIGHGGFPYRRIRSGRECPAPVRFVETQARFPEATKVRQDMGNNGYCQMSLAKDGSVTLRYFDWMSNLRCTAGLAKPSASEPLQFTGVVF